MLKLILIFLFLLPLMGAMDFEGTNDYVALSGVSTTDINEWTISFWLYKRPWSGQDGTMGQGLGGAGDGFAIFTDNAGARTKTIGIYAPNIAGNFDLISPNNTVVDNTWAHFAFVRSVSGSFVKIYKNGVEVATTGNTNMNVSAQTFRLGNIYTGAGGFLDGILDEVHIWNTALSASGVKNDFFGRLLPQTNILGMWRLDEGALNLAPGGVDCVDLSGNEYHGTAEASMTDSDFVDGAPMQWNRGD